MSTVTPDLTPQTTPRPQPMLAPTPMLVPVVRTYMIGDFLRAFGCDEDFIRRLQDGIASGLVSGVQASGSDHAGAVRAEVMLQADDLIREATIMIDTASGVSVTEQVSRKFARAILYEVDKMRRQGLRIEYLVYFTAKGRADLASTRSRLGLMAAGPQAYAPGFRHLYTLHNGSTGMTLSSSSA